MRSRLAVMLVVMVTLAGTAIGSIGLPALAQDGASTPTAAVDGEVVVDGQRYSFDRTVPLDPAQLEQRADDAGNPVLVQPGDDPLGAVYVPGDTGLDRYLPQFLDTPDAACPSAATADAGTIEGAGAVYIPAGIEPDLAPEGLVQVGQTSDGRTLYAPSADQPFAELFATSADGALVHYIGVEVGGAPATFPDRLVFAGQEFELTGGEAPDAEALQQVGCALAFPVLADGAEAGGPYSTVYVQAGDGLVAYRAIGPVEPPIEPVETVAPATPEPTVAPPTETATATATPTVTSTPEPTATPTATATPEPTATPTATATPEPTATPTATSTPEPTATTTSTAEPTATATSPPEPTATTTSTPEPTETATATATPEPTAAPAQPSPTTAPTRAPQPTQTPGPTAPRPTPTPRVLQPPAVVPTVPPDAPPPAAATSAAPVGCLGDAGPLGADGLPERLPRALQYGGTGYRFVEAVPAEELGELDRIGCVGPFDAYRSDTDGELYLASSAVADTVYRYQATTSFSVEVEVTADPRVLVLQGEGDQPDVRYRAGDPLVRSVYSSVTLILYVADAEATQHERILGYAVDHDIFGLYLPEGDAEPAPADVLAQAEPLGIHPTLTLGDDPQTYVLAALWRPFGTTTNGWLTLYGPEGEVAPEQLVGLDPRRLDLSVFNRQGE